MSAPRGQKTRKPFSKEEDDGILEGEFLYREMSNKWARILDDPDFGDRLEGRTNVDIKDRFRNLTNNGAKRPKRTEGEGKESGVREPLRKKKKCTPQEWSDRQTKLLFAALGRHRFGKWAAIMDDPKCKGAFRKMTAEDLKHHFEAIKDIPTEEPLSICVSCGQFSEAFHGKRTFPRYGVGMNAKKYSTTCSVCLRTTAAALAVFLSPMSGSRFKVQQRFLEDCHELQWSPKDAFRAMIDMDHDVQFKFESMSKLMSDEIKSQKQAKEKPFYKEWLQGRCVPMFRADHGFISKEDIMVILDNKMERKKYLETRLKKVDTYVLEKKVIDYLGRSIENFMSSNLFWGVDENGTKRPLEDCLKALRERWDDILHNQTKRRPEILWFIELGHGRVRRQLVNLFEEDYPEDFKEVATVLAAAKANGSVKPPHRLVTLEDIDRELYSECGITSKAAEDADDESSDTDCSSSDDELFGDATVPTAAKKRMLTNGLPTADAVIEIFQDESDEAGAEED